MRVVVDTNVIVSATISANSPPARILRAWDEGRFELIVSTELVDEYRRALHYDRVRRFHRLTDEEIDAIIHDYELSTIRVDPEYSLSTVVEDPDDNRILECAYAGNATCIVTGDRHLLALESYEQILILTPRDFLALLDDELGDSTSSTH